MSDSNEVGSPGAVPEPDPRPRPPSALGRPNPIRSAADLRTTRNRRRTARRAALVAGMAPAWGGGPPVVTAEQARALDSILDLDELIDALRGRVAALGATTRAGDLKRGALRLAALGEKRQTLLEALRPGGRR
jgi:hypothetical protein